MFGEVPMDRLNVVHTGVITSVAALLLLDARPVAAGPENPVALAWDAPPECPSAADVLLRIERALPPAGAVRGRTKVVVHVGAREGGRWKATLRVTTGAGMSERLLEAETCEAIASAASLVSVVAIERDAPAQPSRAPLPPRPPSLPPAALPAPERTLPGGPHFLLAAGVSLDDGVLPNISFGVTGAAGIALRLSDYGLRLLANGAYFPSVTSRSGGTDAAAFDLGTASLLACGTRAFGKVELGPCVGGELDAITGVGELGVRRGRGTGAWGAVLAAAYVALTVFRPVLVFARADGVFAPGVQPFFIANTPDPASGYKYWYPPNAVAFRTTLGIELDFF